MMNELRELIADVPPMLSIGWVTWLGAGALLVLWYRRAQSQAALEPVAAPRPVSKVKSGSRPVSAERQATTYTPPLADARPIAEPRAPEPQVPVVAKPKPKPAPIVVGDPFGDLATLLDQPGGQEPAPKFRTPGDSPILNSAGEPMK